MFNLDTVACACASERTARSTYPIHTGWQSGVGEKGGKKNEVNSASVNQYYN